MYIQIKNMISFVLFPVIGILLSSVGAIVVMIMWQLDLQLPMQSVPITTSVLSSNPTHHEVYLIQHYVIKVAADQWFSPFPPPIKLTPMI